MYVKINDQIFPNAKWTVDEGKGEFWFQTEEPLSHLEEILDPSVAMVIEVYDDNDELKEQWYNRDLHNLSYTKQETGVWYVVATFKVSAISTDSEEEIRQSIDDSDDGIMELAAMISDLDEAFETLNENFDTQRETLNRLSGLYDTLADRVARLENK